MKKLLLASCVALACAPFAASAQFEQFKGKMKPGLYEYKMTMEMPGMPAGMPGMAPQTRQQCMKQEDVETGKFNDKMPKDCQVKNFKMSGNTATYTTECTGQMQMKSDTKVAFNDAGFVMDSTSTMNHGGQPMTSKMHMESKYLGPCK